MKTSVWRDGSNINNDKKRPWLHAYSMASSKGYSSLYYQIRRRETLQELSRWQRDQHVMVHSTKRALHNLHPLNKMTPDTLQLQCVLPQIISWLVKTDLETHSTANSCWPTQILRPINDTTQKDDANKWPWFHFLWRFKQAPKPKKSIEKHFQVYSFLCVVHAIQIERKQMSRVRHEEFQPTKKKN